MLMNLQPYSKRRYSKRKCAHCGKEYIPYDFRQKYCCRQHAVDAANDKRREEKKTRFNNEGQLRKIERVLERLYYRMEQLKIETVTLRELLFAGLDNLHILVEQAQGENNGMIHWYYDYGIQPLDKDGSTFRISKRKS